MKKTILSFLIPFLAGISTIIGYLPTYINEKYQNTVISFSLAFSSSIMFTVSILSLIPEAFHYLNNTLSFPHIIIILIWINIGIILSLLIDKKLEQKIDNSSLYKLGILSIIALIIHNIPEGITTYLTTTNNLKLGISLSLAIALHNIPEGIAIAVPIYYSTNSRKKAFIYTLVSGFSEFLGAILAHIFLKKYINNFILSVILSITAGIMLHLSIFNLLPNSISYQKPKTILIGLIIGMIIMLACIIL